MCMTIRKCFYFINTISFLCSCQYPFLGDITSMFFALLSRRFRDSKKSIISSASVYFVLFTL